jgi:hypothetical protein
MRDDELGDDGHADRKAEASAHPSSRRQILRPIEGVLCIQEDRVVGAGNCVSWRRRWRGDRLQPDRTVLSFP